MKNRKNALTIGGFDPSGGAGILADIKTFEQHKLLGFAVCTANTIQTEDQFMSCNWIDESTIFEQLSVLLKNYSFPFIKIGLIPSLSFLKQLIELPELKSSKFIWDPILSSSSGFNFEHDLSLLLNMLPQIYFITPNWGEIQILSGETDAIVGAKKLSNYCNVYLKGGHHPEKVGKDYLFTLKGKENTFNSKAKKASEKHGSGCVFSSSLTSNFILNYPLQKAILRSKTYTTKYLESTANKLGYHKR